MAVGAVICVIGVFQSAVSTLYHNVIGLRYNKKDQEYLRGEM